MKLDHPTIVLSTIFSLATLSVARDTWAPSHYERDASTLASAEALTGPADTPILNAYNHPKSHVMRANNEPCSVEYCRAFPAKCPTLASRRMKPGYIPRTHATLETEVLRREALAEVMADAWVPKIQGKYEKSTLKCNKKGVCSGEIWA